VRIVAAGLSTVIGMFKDKIMNVESLKLFIQSTGHFNMKVEDVLNQSLLLVNTGCFKNKLKVDTKISTIFNIVKDEIDINKTSLVDKVINLNGNLNKKNKRTINIEKNKIMKIINSNTFKCLVKFEQSLEVKEIIITNNMT